MVMPNGKDEEKANLTIKLVIEKSTNDDQNLTPYKIIEASSFENLMPPRTNDGASIEGVKPKLVINLKRNRANKGKEDEQLESTAPEPKNMLPWNLRTRQSQCEKANALKKDSKERNNSDNNIPRLNIKIALTKKEIEEDFRAMLGHPPPVKPNKRAKVVQNHLDNIFPGLNLKDITAKSYKVPRSPN